MNKLLSRDLWKEILESITANGFRTIITAFGVFWGIFILVILLSSSKGLENGILRGFSGTATNTLFVWAQSISKSYKGTVKGKRYRLKIQDVEAIKQNVQGLSIVSPRNRLGGYRGSNTVKRNLNEGNYSVTGDYPEILTQRSLTMVQGRFLNYGDIKTSRKIAVIGTIVVDELYEKDEKVIGSQIEIKGVVFTVVGVVKDTSTSGDSVENQKIIFVPFTAFAKAFNTADKVNYFAITAKDDYPITDLKDQILDVIKQQHSIHPKDDRAIGNFDLYAIFKKISGLFIALKAVSYFVGFLILISGIIGISNIMLIVIKERTKEIGVRRALGATPGNIRIQVLAESLFLTLISGMAGVSFGAFIIYIVNVLLEKFVTSDDILFVNPSIDLFTVNVALVILVISGLLAGIIPAQTAIKIKPIEALRTE